MDYVQKIIDLQHYQTMINQCIFLQNLASSLSSSLKTSLILLHRSPIAARMIVSPQMQAIQRRMQQISFRIQQNIRNQANLLTQVNEKVKKITNQMQLFMSLIKEQAERISQTLARLNKELKEKDKKIRDCQIALQKAAQQKQQKEFEKQHYEISQIDTSQPTLKYYLRLLVGIRQRIQAQIKLQLQKTAFLSHNACKKIQEFKAKILQTWKLLNQGQLKNIQNRQIKDKSFEAISEQIQRAYVENQRRIDGFDFQEQQKIKYELKLLDYASLCFSQAQSQIDPNNVLLEKSDIVSYQS